VQHVTAAPPLVGVVIGAVVAIASVGDSHHDGGLSVEAHIAPLQPAPSQSSDEYMTDGHMALTGHNIVCQNLACHNQEVISRHYRIIKQQL